MKRQTSKSAASKAVRFELKRMEILRYHNAPIAELGGSDTSFWLILMLALMLAPTAFIKPENKPDKEE
ncbi:MAG: hypothetical protein IJA95_06630 [Bacteroidaceae bacterium]|nr:hypothetical protein [Bacteroidaceae bacterium]